MIFLTNPRTKGKRRMAGKRRTAAQRRATAKLVRLNKARARKRKTNPRRRRRRKATVRRNPPRRRKTVAARRRRTVRRRNTPVRRRRRRPSARRRSPVRRRRRNPPRRFTMRGVTRQLQQGMIDAVGVIGGKVGTRVLAELLPIPGKGAPMMNFLVQAGSAIAVGTVAQMMVSPQVARMVVAGGLATPIESFLRGMPVIGPMLGDDFLELGDADPFLPVGEYPEAVQVGEYDGLTEGAYGVGDADPFLPVGEYAY